MIDFQEELKKFHPSLEVEDTEDAIKRLDNTDMTDIMKELLDQEKRKKFGNESFGTENFVNENFMNE